MRRGLLGPCYKSCHRQARLAYDVSVLWQLDMNALAFDEFRNRRLSEYQTQYACSRRSRSRSKKVAGRHRVPSAEFGNRTSARKKRRTAHEMCLLLWPACCSTCSHELASDFGVSPNTLTPKRARGPVQRIARSIPELPLCNGRGWCGSIHSPSAEAWCSNGETRQRRESATPETR